MKKILYATFLLLCGISAAQAQIYSYTNDTAGNYSSIAANTTALKLIRYNGATRPGSPCGTGFSSNNLTNTTTYSTSLGAVEASVSAASGYLINATSFSVGMRRSGTGPANVRMAYSTDGGTTWIDKGSDDAPNNAGCGSTTVSSWITAVPSAATLKFRLYGFNASSTSGTWQILNLTIDGTVNTTDSIFTGAASFGPFCEGVNDSINVPFTTSGSGFTGLFQVQLSDASGVFPNDATSNIISAGSAISPVPAVIPSTTPWANGYRVRVVNQSPTYYTSGDNGSNIVINQSVTPSFSVLPLAGTSTCAGQSLGFTTASVLNGGSSPVITWYINDSATTVTGSLITYTALHDGDTVSAVLVSNAQCAVPTTVSSNKTTVTIYPTAATALYDTLCPGASLSFGGHTVSTSGVYRDTLQTVHSCDSVLTLHLYVKTLRTSTQSVAICQGDSFVWNGTTYHSAATVHDTISCDSISTLALTYKTVQRTPLTAAICAGGSYVWHGTTYTTQGSYSDTVRCDSIVTLTLTVNQNPTVAYNPADTIICSNTATTVTLSGGSPTSGVFSGSFVTAGILHVAQGIDTAIYISYTYSDANQCSGADSAHFFLHICEGISETSLNSNITIYPNPTENKLHIDASDLSGTSTVTLTDMLGHVVFTSTASGPVIHQDLDLSGYEKGLYLLTIRDGAGTGTKQVVKY